MRVHLHIISCGLHTAHADCDAVTAKCENEKKKKKNSKQTKTPIHFMKHFVYQINSRRHIAHTIQYIVKTHTFTDRNSKLLKKCQLNQMAAMKTASEESSRKMALAKEKFIFDESIPIELIANTAERRHRRRRCRMMPCANECMIFLFGLGDTATAHRTHTHTQSFVLFISSGGNRLSR